MNGYNPVPKPAFPKRPKQKKKLPRMKGRAVPTRGERGKIDKKNAEKMFEVFGTACLGCFIDRPNIEIHHIVFRSQGGRKVWRNLAPLCRDCHGACHGKYLSKSHREAMSGLQNRLYNERVKKYGKRFYCDVWDLYEGNLVSDTTEKEYLKFMDAEENES